MRISDWSSDVCSSDLPAHGRTEPDLTRERQAPCCGPGQSGRPRCRILCTGGAGQDRAGKTAGRLLPGMGRSIRKLATALEPPFNVVDLVVAGLFVLSHFAVGGFRRAHVVIFVGAPGL